MVAQAWAPDGSLKCMPGTQQCQALSLQDSLILTQNPFSQEQAQKVPGSCTKMLTAKRSKGS